MWSRNITYGGIIYVNILHGLNRGLSIDNYLTNKCSNTCDESNVHHFKWFLFEEIAGALVGFHFLQKHNIMVIVYTSNIAQLTRLGKKTAAPDFRCYANNPVDHVVLPH